MKQILFNVDSKKKTRYVSFEIIDHTTYFEILRESGLLGGTAVMQPSLTVSVGKASRSLREQVDLEFRALISKARDKGYKDTIEELSSVKTDDNGAKKPMLASDPKGKLETLIKGKNGYLSPKLDGVRMEIAPTGDWDQINLSSVSRGGKSYDVVCKNIFQEPGLIDFLKAHPDAYIDGELYQHGKLLEEISGAARKKDWDEERHGNLQFWVFDILIEGVPFKERAKLLLELNSLLQTDFVVVIPQVPVTSYAEIMTWHDKWIEEGYEGAVWRDAEGFYEIGGRPKSMLKVKLMQDDEFEIVGAKEGLRPEDMVFVMKTQRGDLFEAKPVGNVVTRIAYLRDIDSLKGKMGTVKFFYISQKGVPNLPIFKNVRPDDE